ncbi:phage head-tail connector protein [Vagococcus lutrae]|uniref:phage head-tail connector protein n=1 Tax=Vagococcus lutrae TaxID=81947 RepID=UPI00289166D0|nr:phage head-tail connector protein [Vagococcus lutrae]MDT2805245.1 phage head-tail connector protein [Vagococcus lutrae]MDT2816287.1 phage head-tail connector protein [Vagococcus lutrae]
MLKDIKLFLGISDTLQDDLLNLIIIDSEERILSKINEYAVLNETSKLKEIPKEYTYIHRDVAIKRFNKINSEGATSDSEEGRSFNWEQSYLDEYLSLFDTLTKPKKKAGKGIARFYE